MSGNKSNPGPVPDRWLRCPRKSEKLIVGKFIALKTPLSTRFDEQVPPEYRFTPKMFMDSCSAKKIKIGLWIDLTNTSRFYDKNEIKDYGVMYHKVNCRGHGETPSKEQTHLFIELVDKYISKFPLQTIAVHCTHGFNRTGFLIISYLVVKMDFSLETAIQMFADARPCGIYKQDYIEELYQRYDPYESLPPMPARPSWCFDEDEDSNNSVPDQFSASTSKKKSKFMEGVPGVFEFELQPRVSQIQRKVQQMCGWEKKGFPGSQPVSMDHNNIKLLHHKPYRVSWKADGSRYMMLIDGENEIYFFDRDFKAYRVQKLKFVHRKNLHAHLQNTLLDGEMVIDKVNGENIPRFLVYDIIAFEGMNIGEMPFYPNRIQYLDNEIIRPRYMAMERGLINKTQEPFSVRKKEFWPITQAGSLLGEKFAKTLSHEPDGLIFQPSSEPYVAGRCDDVLKWKPLDMNSIDFRLKIMQEGGMGKVPTKLGYLYVGQKKDHFGVMKYTKALKDLDNKIVECKYENGQWKFMRERTDKSFPNSYDTAVAVAESIKKPITKEFLLDFIERHRFVTDSEIMPPPKKIRR